MIKRILLLAVAIMITASFVCCGRQSDVSPQYIAIDTSIYTNFHSEVVMELIVPGCREMLGFSDHILLYANMGEAYLSLIPKNGGEIVSFGNAGRGPDEFIQISNICKTGDRSFSLYDEGTKKILSYNVDSIIAGNNRPINSEVISMPARFSAVNNVFLLDNRRKLYAGGVGVMSKAEQVRFALCGNFESTVSYYDALPHDEDTMRMKIAYSAHLPLISISPDLKHMVVANNPWGAIMEIFDIKGSNIELQNTSYIIRPEFEYEDGVITNSSNSVAGFTDIYFADETIAALYIGEPIAGMPRTKIVLFDMSGNVRCVCPTKSFANQILYDKARNVIYTTELQPMGTILLEKYFVEK